MLLTGVAVAADPSDQVRQSLDVVGSPAATREDSQRKVAAIKVLAEYSQEAIPLIIDRSKDKRKPLGNRDQYLRMLTQKEFSPNLSPAHYQQLLSIVGDADEHPVIRIDAAVIVLRNDKSMTDAQRQMVKQTAFDLVKKGENPGLVDELILSHFAGDTEVENFLLDRLQNEQDKNSVMIALGKIHSLRGLDAIKKLLDSPEAGKSFYKVRAYAAIGDIGGDRAFDYLTEYLKKEKGTLHADSITFAIGRTKTARATKYLLDRLERAGTDDVVILMAIKFSGDASAIPVLQQELAKAKTASRRQALQQTIAALQKGDDSWPW